MNARFVSEASIAVPVQDAGAGAIAADPALAPMLRVALEAFVSAIESR